MITQRLGSQGAPMEYWQFTVNTEATTAGEKRTGIPFNLYGQNDVVLLVDWGDGTTSRLTSADYTAERPLTLVSASIHEYSIAGIYTITVSSHNFDSCYIWGVNSDMIPGSSIYAPDDGIMHMYLYKSTLVSVDTAMPFFYGKKNFTSSSASMSSIQTYDRLTNAGLMLTGTFARCAKLVSVPSSLLINYNDGVSYRLNSFFNLCTSLPFLPTEIFAPVHYLSRVTSTLLSCDALSDFELRFTARSINNCTNFVTYRAGATRIIYVPSGSTTETTFNNVASTLGLTIIGE